MRRSRNVVLGAALLALALLLGACGSGEDDESNGGGGGGEEDKGSVAVGSVNFAENNIVAEMYALVLEDAGYEVDRKTVDSREILQPALESGEIDVAPEYLSSLLLFEDPQGEASGDPEAVLDALTPILEEKGVTLLEPSDANDTNAFVVAQETADEHSLSSISDLAAVAGELTLGGPPECPERPFCIPGLKDVYGVEFGSFKALDVGGPLTVAALKGGKIDVALLFSTSSVIGQEGWVVLEDDQGLQNAENITPAINADALNDEISGLLDSVSALLTTDNVTELNGRVEVDQEDPRTVAEEFLTEQGLL